MVVGSASALSTVQVCYISRGHYEHVQQSYDKDYMSMASTLRAEKKLISSLLRSPHDIALLCSLSLASSVLPVPPTYVYPH